MLRSVVLVLTVASGFTGLAYEVTWQKYLAILLGAHSEATATVLGLFLGGLSLGYGLFGAVTRALVARGRREDRPAPLLLVYGAVEAGIGIYCLLFPVLFAIARSASLHGPTGQGVAGFAFDVVLAALLIVPPATLMGGTIPILTQALARDLEDATRVHALIYASNTVGAFAGTLATGFVLVHWLGLDGILHVMGWVNVAIGSVFAVLGTRRREVVALDVNESATLRPQLFAVYGIVALLVGFAMMVLQTMVIRMGALAFGASEYTFTMVVAVFVLCIAIGSYEVSGRSRIGRHALVVALWSLALLFTGLYFVLETTPYWGHVLRIMFRDINPAFYPYSLLVFGCLLVMLAPAVIVSGAMLPLLFHTLRHEVGDLGSQAGRLYSANTLGSLLGALIGGYLLLIWLDLHHVYRIAVAALALAATIVTLHQFPRIRFVGAATLLIAVLATVSSFHAWRPEYLAAGAFRVRQPTSWSFMGPSGLVERNWTFSFYDDDPNTSVAINDSGTGDDLTRSIIVNGKSDGNTAGDYTTTALLALVPALFAESAEQAFVIGFGTGTTAGILANLEDTKSVTIAEISSGVIKGSPLFDFFNKNVSTNPKIHIVHSDAYRALLKGGGQYDVIVSEPSNPWVAGIEQLYSQEFLAAARDHLKPTGVYCQWFHYYEMNPEAVALVLKTYASVFDHVAVWSTNYADGMLLGFQDPERALDLDRFDQRIARPDFAAVLERLGIRDGATLLAHEVLPIGVANAATLPGAVHSLYHPLLSYAAGRAFFVGQRADLPFTGYGEPARVGADHSLLGRYLARAEPARRASLYGEVATYVCEHQLPGCSALVAKWGSVDGESAEFRQLANQLRTQRGPFYIRRLRGLIEGMPRNADGRLRPAVAASMTQLYMEQYAHSVPFDPDTLLRIWERCGYDEPGIERCHPGLSVAQRFMAGESPPDPQLWLVPEVQEPSTTHHAATPEPLPVGEAKDAKDEPNGHEAGEGEDL